MTMPLFNQFAYPASAALCASFGAWTDMRTRRIPNLLTGPGIAAGLVLHTAVDGSHGLLSSASAGLVCGSIFLLFFLAGGMGAGDVKLITAAACLGGWPLVAPLLIFTAIAGGVMALALATMRGRLGETLGNVVALASHHHTHGLTPHPELHVLNARTLRLPYGVAIAAGCLLTLLLQPGVR